MSKVNLKSVGSSLPSSFICVNGTLYTPVAVDSRCCQSCHLLQDFPDVDCSQVCSIFHFDTSVSLRRNYTNIRILAL